MACFVLGIILFVIGIPVGVAGLIMSAKNADKDKELGVVGKVMSGVGFGAGLLFGIGLPILACFSTIPTGHVGIVTTFGKVEPIVLDSGINTKAPWQTVIEMDNRVQKETVTLESFSSDIQEVSVVYTVNYQIRKADAMTIYSTVGTDYYNIVIKPTVMESIKTVTAKYTAEALISNRTELAEGIEELLGDSLDAYNIIVVSTAIEDMDFSDAFTTAVEQKQVAAQNKLQAQIEQEQKTMEAEAAAKRAEIEAEAAKNVAIIQAEADLETTKISADAAEYAGQKEASKNKAITEALTKDLLEYYYIQQWDGKLPDTYVGNEDASTIILNK